MGKIGWLLLHDTSFLASEKQKWWGVKNLQVLFILAPDFHSWGLTGLLLSTSFEWLTVQLVST